MLPLVFHSLQASNSGLDYDSRVVVVQVQIPPAALFMWDPVPDPHSSSLSSLGTEGGSVLVQADFNFLCHFTEGGTIRVLHLLMILTFLVHIAMSLQIVSSGRINQFLCGQLICGEVKKEIQWGKESFFSR